MCGLSAREVQLRRNRLVLQRQHGLDQAGHAGRRLEVADVGLDRAEQARRRRRRRLPDRGGERLDLDRIAERGAGAVRLDEADPRRRRAARCASASRTSACCARPFGAASTVEWPSWLTAEPRITASTRSPSATASASRLSTTTPQPSPRPKPSARGVEGLAAAVGRHEADLRHRDQQLGRDHQRHAAGEREVALAAAQALAGEVDRHQRRASRRCRSRGSGRAGRGGTTAGWPARCAACRSACARRSPRGRRTAAARSRCGSWRRTRRCGCRASRSRGKPGVVERLDRHLEEQPLLRVHALGLARQDAEVVGVEAVDLRAGSRPVVVSVLPGAAGSGSVPGVGIPALGGTSPTASTPSRSSCQKRSGVSPPPGKRQPMPTMAIGSASQQRLRLARAPRAPSAPASWPRVGDAVGARRSPAPSAAAARAAPAPLRRREIGAIARPGRSGAATATAPARLRRPPAQPRPARGGRPAPRPSDSSRPASPTAARRSAASSRLRSSIAISEVRPMLPSVLRASMRDGAQLEHLARRVAHRGVEQRAALGRGWQRPSARGPTRRRRRRGRCGGACAQPAGTRAPRARGHERRPVDRQHRDVRHAIGCACAQANRTSARAVLRRERCDALARHLGDVAPRRRRRSPGRCRATRPSRC